MTPDVEVLGPSSWNTLIRLDALPDPRPQTIFARASWDTVGGTSAGKALHLRNLGRPARLTTVLGDDDAGLRVRQALLEAGVDVDPLTVAGPSERHTNLMTEAGQRLSIYVSTPAEPAVPTTVTTRIQSAKAAVVDLAPWTRELVVGLDGRHPNVWTDVHDYDGAAEFHAPFVSTASYVFMNADAVGRPGELMHRLVDDGVSVVVCTLGAEGAMAVDARHDEWHVPAARVERIVDTNGAGDGFLAGFLHATLDGAGVEPALRAGADQAARALRTRHLSPLLQQA